MAGKQKAQAVKTLAVIRQMNRIMGGSSLAGEAGE
jgi:hypothetical protein